MSRPWMPLYVADYLADTAHLGALQSGAYLHLIMHYWQHGGLPENDAALMRIARLTQTEWKRERAAIASFFHDGWKHKRIDAELAHAAEISSKRRASAERRHSKGDANAHANAEQAHMQMDTHACALPQPQSQEDTSSLRSDVGAQARKPSPKDELETALDAEHATAVIEHRQRFRKPLTARAAKLLAKKFAACPDPNAAADAMIGNGWQGFEPEWLENRNSHERNRNRRPVHDTLIAGAAAALRDRQRERGADVPPGTDAGGASGRGASARLDPPVADAGNGRRGADAGDAAPPCLPSAGTERNGSEISSERLHHGAVGLPGVGDQGRVQIVAEAPVLGGNGQLRLRAEPAATGAAMQAFDAGGAGARKATGDDPEGEAARGNGNAEGSHRRSASPPGGTEARPIGALIGEIPAFLDRRSTRAA